MAFTFKSLGELLDTHTRLKESGIRPDWCINHGRTTSMYYCDPDNNQGEPLIDNFDDIREGKAYMQSPAFAKNPIGVPFEPESSSFAFRLEPALQSSFGSSSRRRFPRRCERHGSHAPDPLGQMRAHPICFNATNRVMACWKVSNPNPNRSAPIGLPRDGV